MRLIDMHCDTIYELMKHSDENLKENSLCINIDRMKQAESTAQFFACFVNMKTFEGRDSWTMAYNTALEMIARGKKEFAANANDISLALGFDDLCRNEQEGKISAFLTIEEGGILENDMSRLERLYQEGIRLITLTWNHENSIGYPNKMRGGLKPFGIEAVRRMNDLGMLVDVSHLSDEGFWDVIAHSEKPIVASHSNARALCGHARNLTDEMIKALAENGGVAGINFYPYFLSESGKSTAENIAAHVVHMYRIGGEDVVAIGTDFDGFDDGESEISHLGQMDVVYDAIKKQGFTERQMEKIWNKNAVRVIKEGMR